MKIIRTVKELCEKIWEMERDLGLLDLKVQEVKVWQALRMSIYYEVAQELDILELPHTKQGASKYKIKSLLRFLYSSFRYNPFLNLSEKEILIFDHPRKVLSDGMYIDIYTKYLIDDLKNREETFEVYEKSYLGNHWTKPEKNRQHLDFIRLCTKLYTSLPRHKFTQNEVNLIRNLEGNIIDKLGIKLDLIGRFQKYIKWFRAQYALYRKLFKIKSPRKIYIVVSYGLAPIIQAAKDMGVEVVELQHGVFSDYHLGYSFPGVIKDSLAYFPDRLLVWGDFWKSMCSLPLSDKKIGIQKFTHFEKKICEFSGVDKKNNQIVVISQGVVGTRLSEMVLNNIEDLHEYNIIYKLHPGEYDRWRDYPSLIELESYENVSIVDNSMKPLYELLAESKYVIGVFSTALFEAMDFKCNLLLVNLPGIEYMQRLIRNGKAVCVGQDMRIIDALNRQEKA